MHTLRISGNKPCNIGAEYSSMGNIECKGRRHKKSMTHSGSLV